MNRKKTIDLVYNKYPSFKSWKDFYRKISLETNEEWSWDCARKYIKYHNLKDNYKNKIDNSPGKTEVINDNSLVFEYQTKNKPTSLEEILSLFKVDTSVWKVDKYSINSWDMTNRNGEVFTNYQIKVFLVRIVPITQHLPPLKSVTISTKNPIVANYSRPLTDIKRALVLGDAQLGFRKDIHTGKLTCFHDRIAMDTVLQMLSNFRYDHIVILGDMLDLPSWSDRFLKEPEFYFTTQPALKELYWWLRKIRMSNPNAQIDYLEGNHEKRLSDFVKKYMYEAYKLSPVNSKNDSGLFSIENLLDLDSLFINWIPDYPRNSVWLNEKLVVNHGIFANSKSGKTVTTILDKTDTSSISGHNHRVELASKRVHLKDKSEVNIAVSTGCLCKTDGTVPSNQRQENWQQGVTHVTYNDEFFTVTPLLINNGILPFGPHIIKGKDRTAEISKDIEWEL